MYLTYNTGTPRKALNFNLMKFEGAVKGITFLQHKIVCDLSFSECFIHVTPIMARYKEKLVILQSIEIMVARKQGLSEGSHVLYNIYLQE